MQKLLLDQTMSKKQEETIDTRSRFIKSYFQAKISTPFIIHIN